MLSLSLALKMRRGVVGAFRSLPYRLKLEEGTGVEDMGSKIKENLSNLAAWLALGPYLVRMNPNISRKHFKHIPGLWDLIFD